MMMMIIPLLFGEVKQSRVTFISPVFLNIQDLAEEGQVVQVGSLSVRWVLLQHARPWLLTIADPKQRFQSHPISDRFKNQQRSSDRGKRCRREAPQETEGPPAKRSAVDKQEGGERDKTREKPSEEEQRKKKEGENEGSGDKLLNLEEKGENQIHPQQEIEEEAGKGKVGSEELQEETNELIARDNSTDNKKEDSSPPAAPTSADDQ